MWSPACQGAFDGLRSILANAVMRHHFDPSLPTTITTDAADGCLGAAMHQAKPANPLQPQPMAFMSKTMILAGLNYFIHDKELLAIVHALEEWDPEFLSLQEPFAVETDHRALEYFMTKQKLNARQARWAEYLSRSSAKSSMSRETPPSLARQVPNLSSQV